MEVNVTAGIDEEVSADCQWEREGARERVRVGRSIEAIRLDPEKRAVCASC